jgi:hypothetical protein
MPKTAVTSSCLHTFHALTDRALVAAVAWKYIANNPTSNIKPSKPHGSGFHKGRPRIPQRADPDGFRR